MKVLFTHPGSELYGSDRMIIETVKAAIADGCETHLVLPADGPLADLARHVGATVEIVSSPVLRKELMNARGLLGMLAQIISALPPMIRTIRRARPAVVWANTITQPWWMLAARLSRTQVVVHVRESESGLPRILQRCLVAPLAMARVIVSNSRYTQQFVTRNVLPLTRRARTYRVIYNGKDWEHYYRNDPTPFESPLRLLVVGRLSPRKGQDIVLRAMVELRQMGIDTHLTLAGDVFPGYEWYRDELEYEGAALPAGADCSLIGFVQDPSSCLRDADIVLVPSRIEPFGTVAAEAMAAKRPVIVAAVDGLVEVVKDGVTGVTFAPGDSHDLAAKIADVCQHPRKAGMIAEAGFRFVNETLSSEQYLREVRDVLQLFRED